MSYFWSHDVTLTPWLTFFESMTLILPSWYTFLRHDTFVHVMTYFCFHDVLSILLLCNDIMAYLWLHNILFEVMAYFLTSWRSFYVKTSWRNFWHHNSLFSSAVQNGSWAFPNADLSVVVGSVNFKGGGGGSIL